MSNSGLSKGAGTEFGFAERHIGLNPDDLEGVLEVLGCDSLDQLIDRVVPTKIRLRRQLNLPAGKSETEVLARLREIASRNQLAKSYIGLGYSGCITPPVIQRNILENPNWYTAYTPYQPEIAQGRLEALLNFQTMITDLTGLEIANASLLDEGTAAAEAMTLCFSVKLPSSSNRYFVSDGCHPQTIAVVQTRAEPLGIKVLVQNPETWDLTSKPFGALLQYPTTTGAVEDYRVLTKNLHEAGAKVAVATDLLSLTLLMPPGEFGADICVGSSQRFGVPMGFGGPHAAFFAARNELKRHIPGRLVGVSKDTAGRVALRLALQTREQHIRRDRATSNICTAQVLLAVIASSYAVYHGPKRLRRMAERIHFNTQILALGLQRFGLTLSTGAYFDTLKVDLGTSRDAILERAKQDRTNFRHFQDGTIGISLDETTTNRDLQELLDLFSRGDRLLVDDLAPEISSNIPLALKRNSPFLEHPVFNSYHTETELLRYLHRLEQKDLSLTTSMIPLGSCTMKLNGTAEMMPVTWPEFSQIHPFAPAEQTVGYLELISELQRWLADITGFTAVSLQPNAGSQGEFAGLLTIRQHHLKNGNHHRNACLIPNSAHGTNPASAVMAGFRVVPILCDAEGDIDLEDLRKKAEANSQNLGALMITYPSTHGVFETEITEICDIIHGHGGQVYLDGANMNAQVGLCRPADFGADVCHLNLHKTFCIPHGGGGPGVGPVCVKAHLADFLPGHPLAQTASLGKTGPVSSAPFGSAGILCISWAYIHLMGPDGLTNSSKIAIANANYVAQRLSPYFPVRYRGKNGLVAHECIIDLRHLKKSAGVEVEDVAKRLVDYGFHAPTMSWPVPGTMMIEPTESESKRELDRFCDAMISIYGEIRAIETNEADKEDNVLKRAPHTAEDIIADSWNRGYTRESAAYPSDWSRQSKYWPPVSRIDNVFGDRNLFCSCVPVTELVDETH